MNQKDAESIHKSIYVQLIISRITCLLIKMYEKKKCKSRSNSIINKSTLTQGLYEDFLYLFINGRLNKRIISRFAGNYIVAITTNKGKSIPRICTRPYMKWYIKQYFKKYTKASPSTENG
jgi:hypothetical protein